MSSAVIARSRPGRPRHIPVRSSRPPREEIIDTAARLFTDSGFAATSTRDIAEAIGIRQASLYYHFPEGKDTILTEVLGQTIRPTLESIDRVEDLTDEPSTALYLLALLDIRTLADAPHNSGFWGCTPTSPRRSPSLGSSESSSALSTDASQH